MTRLPNDRDTHLTPDEVVGEALRQFDRGEGEPSIRRLAAALRVAPSAIYHHFPSRAAIIDGAVERVQFEAMSELLSLMPRPLEADPVEVLVATGLASRRAWLRHHRLSPYLAASPESNDFTRNALALMADLFKRLGLDPDRAAVAFHGYSTFMIGSVLFAASRRSANDDLARDPEAGRPAPGGDPAEPSRKDPTYLSLEQMVDISITDPARDEQLYEEALRKLVVSLVRD